MLVRKKSIEAAAPAGRLGPGRTEVVLHNLSFRFAVALLDDKNDYFLINEFAWDLFPSTSQLGKLCHLHCLSLECNYYRSLHSASNQFILVIVSIDMHAYFLNQYILYLYIFN